MKNLSLFLVSMLLLTVTLYPQVTNLTVNGQSSSFTMVSGDLLGWSYDVPAPGDSTLIQIWVDTDQNGVINPAVDVLWVYFVQIDGDKRGHKGPPDIDGLVNGHVSFQQKLGLAPAHYIMLFKNHNNYKYVLANITSLASPAITVSGSVSVPAGFRKQYIMFSLENQGNDGGGTFWNGLTDANGNFTIQMNSDTSGNPWNLKPDNVAVFGSSVVSPENYPLVLNPNTPSYSGKNFTVTAAAAEVKGTLKDENGNPVLGNEVFINSNNGNFFRYSQTDTAGVFHVGLLSSELPQAGLNLSSGGDQYDTTQVMASFGPFSVKSGDVFTHNLTIFKTNSTISGKVTINGNPLNFGMQLNASNQDTGFVNTFTDANGNFVFHVSNKIFNYFVNTVNLPQGYNYASVLAHPGQKNVVLNLTLTDVKSGGSDIPLTYSLSQNFPNPFNPATIINYSIANAGQVKLTIYNAVGEKVATIVNEFKPAGNYSVQFNGRNLASGIYLYRLESGSFNAAKKFILLK